MNTKEYMEKFKLKNYYSFPMAMNCIYSYLSANIYIDLVRVGNKEGLFLFIKDYAEDETFLFEWIYSKKDFVDILSVHNYFWDIEITEEGEEIFFTNNTINKDTDIPKLEADILESFIFFMINKRKDIMAKKYNLK